MRPDDKRRTNPGHPRRSHCIRGHPLGESDNVGLTRRVTASGKVTQERYCRTCVRDRNRAARARRG